MPTWYSVLLHVFAAGFFVCRSLWYSAPVPRRGAGAPSALCPMYTIDSDLIGIAESSARLKFLQKNKVSFSFPVDVNFASDTGEITALIVAPETQGTFHMWFACESVGSCDLLTKARPTSTVQQTSRSNTIGPMIMQTNWSDFDESECEALFICTEDEMTEARSCHQIFFAKQ